MQNLRRLLLLLLFGGGVCSAGFAAQMQADSLVDFKYVKYYDAWLTSSNAAGLRFLPVEKTSIAEIFVLKNDGGFVNYYQSDDSYTLGAHTESFFRMSPKVVFYGNVDFSNFKGYNMGASGFIDPAYNAFDIDELTYETRGTKVLESYYLSGGVSADVWRGLTLGGKIDYRTANYAKHKDLRHTNSLLDLTLSSGALYRFGKNVTIGANYLYRRSVEGLSYAVYGNTDKQYTSLVNFGSFYGRTELLGESGYTYGDNPTFNRFHGGSLQVSTVAGKFSLFNEFSYESRNGYYGDKSPRTPVYTDHSAYTVGYTGVLSFRNQNNLHRFELSADYKSLDNYENIFDRETQTGGKYDIIYHGKNLVHERDVINACVEYTANLTVEGYFPLWVVKSGAAYNSTSRNTSIYPFFRKQQIDSYDIHASACRNIIDGKNIYSISLDLSYGAGSGTAKDDGAYAAPSENQKKPVSIDDYLYREYEFLTATRIKGGAHVEYSRIIAPSTRGYVALRYEMTNAINIKYLDDNKFSAFSLTLGCLF